MNQVTVNSKVKVHYTGKLANGEVFDTSDGKEPIEFTLGQGQLIPGFEKGLIDMKLNEKKTINMTKDEAREIFYGMPFAQWKAEFQTEVSSAKQETFLKNHQ